MKFLNRLPELYDLLLHEDVDPERGLDSINPVIYSRYDIDKHWGVCVTAGTVNHWLNEKEVNTSWKVIDPRSVPIEWCMRVFDHLPIRELIKFRLKHGL